MSLASCLPMISSSKKLEACDVMVGSSPKVLPPPPSKVGLKKKVVRVARDVMRSSSKKKVVLPACNVNIMTSDDECYDLASYPHLGHALLFNQYKFIDPGVRTREGTASDVTSLTSALTHRGFEVHPFDDLTRSQINDIVDEYCDADKHWSSAAILVIVLSHGTAEDEVWAHDEPYSPHEMFAPLLRCPSLEGKLILMILQACRGGSVQPSFYFEIPSPVADASMTPQTLQAPNLIMAYSTVKGYESFRLKSSGSWYIQNLCKELPSWSGDVDLVTLLTRVNRRVVEEYYSNFQGEEKAQTPIFRNFASRPIVIRRCAESPPAHQVSGVRLSITSATSNEDAISINTPEINKTEEHYSWSARSRVQAVVYHDIQHAEHAKKMTQALSFCDVRCELIQENFTRSLVALSRDESLSGSDCLLVVVLATRVTMRQLEVLGMTFNDVWAPFVASKCPKLRSKPKLFFELDAFANTKTVTRFSFPQERESPQSDSSAVVRRLKITEHADFLFVHGCNSEFVTSLTTILAGIQNCQQDFMTSLLQAVKLSDIPANKGQRSYLESSLRYKLTFQYMKLEKTATPNCPPKLSQEDKIRELKTSILRQKNGELAIQILDSISFMDKAGIPIILLQNFGDKEERENALELLHKFKFINYIQDTKLIFIHFSTQEINRKILLKQNRHLQNLELALEICENEMKDNAKKEFHFSSSSIEHVMKIWEHASKYLHLLTSNCNIPIHIIQDLIKNMKYKEAKEFAQNTYILLHNNLAQNDIRILKINMLQCSILMHLGYSNESKLQIDEVLNQLKTQHPNSKLEYVQALRIKGQISEKFGNFNEALSIFNECLILQASDLNNNYEMLVTKLCIAGVLQNLGKFNESIEKYNELIGSLTTDSIEGLESDSEIKKINSNKGSIFLKRGEYKRAFNTFNELLIAEITTYGYDHPITIITKRNIAESLRGMKKFKWALKIYKNVLKVYLNVFDPKYIDVLDTKSSIAELMSDLGESDEALSICNEIIKIQIEKQAQDDYSTIITRFKKANILRNMGKYELALDEYEKVSHAWKLLISSDHYNILDIKFNIALTLLSMDKYKGAYDLFEYVWKTQNNIFGCDSIVPFRARKCMAYTLQKLGCQNKELKRENDCNALQIYKELINDCKLDMNDPFCLDIRFEIAYLQMNSRNYRVAYDNFILLLEQYRNNKIVYEKIRDYIEYLSKKLGFVSETEIYLLECVISSSKS